MATAAHSARVEQRATYHREAVERAIVAMSDRLDEQFSLESLAELAFFSPYHFHRVFRGVTGVAPRRFQSALRIEEAKRLLLTSDLSVTEICFNVGYHSLGTFTSQFTRLVGVSPRSLREFARNGRPGSRLPPLESHPADAGMTTVHGRLDVVASTSSVLVAVGLFPTPVAEGCPAGCTLAVAPGAYELAAEHAGHFHVLAMSMPRADDLSGLLLCDDDARVASAGPVIVRSGGSACRINLVLRRRRVTDPPVLLSPAVLAAGGRSTRERANSAHAAVV